MKRDHIGVAFDDKGHTRGSHRGLRLVKAVEHFGLVEERRFTGVEVFWLTRADNAAAERDALALHIVDGKHGAVEETILRAEVVAASHGHIRFDHLRFAEPQRRKMRHPAAAFPAQTPSSTFSARSHPDRAPKDNRALPALRVKDRA